MPPVLPPVGIVVEIHGLRCAADLNGQRGVVLPTTAELSERGRVGVAVDDGRQISLKPTQVSAVAAAETVRHRGTGLVAKLAIRAGDLVLREAPALTGRLGEEPSSKHFSRLPEGVRRDILELHDSYADGPGDATLAGIFATNGLPRGERSDGLLLCPLASRANHSCAPNAEYLWVEDKAAEEIRAVRDIAVDEEVCVNYIGDDVRQPSESRQSRLRGGYRFNCACSVCGLPPEDLRESDDRRKRLGHLSAEILSCRSKPEEGVRLAEEMLELISAEGIGAPRTVGQVCNDGFELAVLSGDTDDAQYWAHLSYEAHRIGWGEHHPMTKQMKAHAQQPLKAAMASAARSAQAPARSEPAADPKSKGPEAVANGVLPGRSATAGVAFPVHDVELPAAGRSGGHSAFALSSMD